MKTRDYTPVDQLLFGADQALRTLFGKPQTTERANPANNVAEVDMDDKQREHTARLMRINHTGEVCAQALYQGQALTARNQVTRDNMQTSAEEENDHLDWCEQRVNELGGRLSLLNPLWYAGSFAMGAAAGAIGDKWSLGFVAETEKQVENHLAAHQAEIPVEDQRTQAILQQMKVDEIAHGEKALAQGGADLPPIIKQAMQAASKVMTQSVYHF